MICKKKIQQVIEKIQINMEKNLKIINTYGFSYVAIPWLIFCLENRADIVFIPLHFFLTFLFYFFYFNHYSHLETLRDSFA